MSLFKIAVQFCIKELAVDRSAVFTLDLDSMRMFGTWGTNKDGRIYQDDQFHQDIEPNDWLFEMIQHKQTLQFRQQVQLETSGNKESKGWQLAAVMYIDGIAKAWLSCDNLILQRPLLPAQKEIVTVFCASLNQWFQSIIDRQQLKSLSQSLQERVNQRTKKLQDSLVMLGKTQGKLTAYEKLT